jgi:hypothetical protein
LDLLPFVARIDKIHIKLSASMAMTSQGIGAYLMDAAQTFGDNLTGIADRIGELTNMGISSLGSALLGGSAVAAAAAGTSPEQDEPAVGGIAPARSNVIMLPAQAVSNIISVKDNPVALEWSSASAAMVLGELPSPVTPAMDMPARAEGMRL